MADALEPIVGEDALPGVPDFDTYPIEHWPVAAGVRDGGVDIAWDDGAHCLFHPLTLRENAPDPATTHPVTREQALMLTDIPADLAAVSAEVAANGAVSVRWSTGEESRFHPGWLRAHGPGLDDRGDDMPARVLWDSGFANALPRIDGGRLADDPDELMRWVAALHVHGVAIVEGLGSGHDVIERVPGLLGPLRDSNFGRIFDVVTKTDADSNAYTAMALPLHVDLATREYMPGLQFLHCLQNDADGGDSVVADGFTIAEALRREAPDLFEAISTVPLTAATKAVGTDHRWSSPMIRVDGNGDLVEVRWNPWLRAPLRAPFEVADKVYQALRRLFDMGEQDRFRVVTRLKPGDMLCFDNRRVLHGRTGFDPASGNRALRGCYVDREELHSRLRILARQRRAHPAP